MNKPHFDSVAQIMTNFPSRRNVLRGLAGMGFGLGIARLPDLVEAKKKRKRKRKKKQKPARPNEFGCFEVGDPCTSVDDCCSGICEGKTCRAHGTGICRQDRVGVCSATTTDVPTFVCGNECYCFGTTAGSNFCAVAPAGVGSPKCADCKKDADCLALGFPDGSACVPVGLGHCSGRCETGMACLVPCGVEFPPPPEG
jgi:hypothetical protein